MSIISEVNSSEDKTFSEAAIDAGLNITPYSKWLKVHLHCERKALHT